MIRQESIEEVRHRASLLEVVGESVMLKRAGSGHVGLCPFHQERSPSFHISSDERFFHCFGCGASGNVISFVMRSKGLSFVEAVEYLAERYQITLQRDRQQGESRGPAVARPRLFTMQRLAVAYFREALRSAPQVVHDYLQSRQVRAETIDQFGIGFAPGERRGLTHALLQRGFSEEETILAGLSKRTAEGEVIDVFRNRIVFPVWIDDQRVVAFGGRIVPALVGEQSTAPKYLNSPETPLYQKQKTLFGFPQAFPTMRSTQEVFVVEGYMDVVGLAQAGILNVVAACGTAVTEHHARRLKNVVQRVLFLFDGDSAGRSAGAKVFKTMLNSGLDCRAVFLPEGEDPDTFALKAGTNVSAALTGLRSEPLLECFLHDQARRFGSDSLATLPPALKGRVAAEVATTIRDVENPVEREELLRRSGSLLGVGAQLVASAAPPPRAPAPTLEKKEPKDVSGTPVGALPALDRELLLAAMAEKGEVTAIILGDPSLCSVLETATLSFVQELHEVVSTTSDREEQREQVKSILKERGESWVEHWRRAHKMGQDHEVNFKVAVENCRAEGRKAEVRRLLDALERRQRESSDPGEQGLLSQERLKLERTLRG